MSASLKIRFLDWWLAGTGQSLAGGSDKNAYRDEWGCPALPASQVKGTLRETASLWAGWDDQQVVAYFGSHSDATDAAQSVPGHLVFSGDARLEGPDRAWFAANPGAQKELFGRLPATAIDPQTGTAKDRSLRQIEAVVPMELCLVVSWDGADPPPDDWVDRLDELCAFTPAFGAGKQDGFGRAVAKIERLRDGGEA